MRDTTEAVAEVALSLARDPARKSKVMQSLFAVISDFRTLLPQTAAACRAVQALARSELLDLEWDEQLFAAICLDRPHLDRHGRSLLVDAAAALPSSRIPATLVYQLSDWGRTAEDWLGWRAIGALIEWRHFSAHSDWIAGELGLSVKNEEWVWQPTQTNVEWATLLIAQLYAQAPTSFAAAMRAILLHPDWLAGHGAVVYLAHVVSRGLATLEAVAASAVIERATRRNTPRSADVSLVLELPRICLNEFANENWVDFCSEWLPEARAALADAMGETGEADPKAKPNVSRTLLALAGDGHFGGRRSAYRAMSAIAPDLLSSRVGALMASALVQDRQHAAEAWPWLRDSNFSRESAHARLPTSPSRCGTLLRLHCSHCDGSAGLRSISRS